MERFLTFTATCQFTYQRLLRTVSLLVYQIHARTELSAKNYGQTSSANVRILGHMSEIIVKSVSKA